MTKSKAQEEIAGQLVLNSVNRLSDPKALFSQDDITYKNVSSQPLMVYDFGTVYDTTAVKARQMKIKEIRNWLLYVIALYLIYFLLYWIGLMNWMLDNENQTDNVIKKTQTPNPAKPDTVFIGFLAGFFTSSTILAIFFTDNSQQPVRRGIATKFVASFVVYGLYVLFLYALGLLGRLRFPSTTCSIIVISGLILEICLLTFLALYGYTNRKRWLYNGILAVYIGLVYFLGCYPRTTNGTVAPGADHNNPFVPLIGIIALLAGAAITLGASIAKKLTSATSFVAGFLYQGLAAVMTLLGYIYSKFSGGGSEKPPAKPTAPEIKPTPKEPGKRDKEQDKKKKEKEDNGEKDKEEDEKAPQPQGPAPGSKKHNPKDYFYENTDFDSIESNPGTADGNGGNETIDADVRKSREKRSKKGNDDMKNENDVFPVYVDNDFLKAKTQQKQPKGRPNKGKPGPKPKPPQEPTLDPLSIVVPDPINQRYLEDLPQQRVPEENTLAKRSAPETFYDETPPIYFPDTKEVPISVNPAFFSDAVKNSSVNFTAKSMVKALTKSIRKTFNQQNDFFEMKPGLRVSWTPPRMFRIIPEAKFAMDFLLKEQNQNLEYFHEKFLPLEDIFRNFASGFTTIADLQQILTQAQSIVQDVLTVSKYSFVIMDELNTQFAEFRSNNQKAVDGIRMLEALLDNDINLEGQQDTIYRIQENILKLLADAAAIKSSAQLLYQFEVEYNFEIATQPSMVDPSVSQIENILEGARRGINNAQNSLRTQLNDGFSNIPTTTFPEPETAVLPGTLGRDFVDQNQMERQIADSFVTAAIGGGLNAPVRYAFNGEVLRRQRENEKRLARERKLKKAARSKPEKVFEVSASTIPNVTQSLDPAQVPISSLSTINAPVAPETLSDSLSGLTVGVCSVQWDPERLNMSKYFQMNRELIFSEYQYFENPVAPDPVFDSLPSGSDDVYSIVSKGGFGVAAATVVLASYLYQKSKASGEVQALAELEDKSYQYNVKSNIVSKARQMLGSVLSPGKQIFRNFSKNATEQSRSAMEPKFRQRLGPTLPYQDASYVSVDVMRKTVQQYKQQRAKSHEQFASSLSQGLEQFRNEVSRNIKQEMSILVDQFLLANPQVSRKNAMRNLEQADEMSNIQAEREYAFLQKIQAIISGRDFRNEDLVKIINLFVEKQDAITPFEKRTYVSLSSMMMVSFSIQEMGLDTQKQITNALRAFKIRIDGNPLRRTGYDPRESFQRTIRNCASRQGAAYYGSKLLAFQHANLQNMDDASASRLFYNSDVAEKQMDNARKIVETNVSQGVANDMRSTAIDVIDNPLSRVPEDIRIAQYLAKQPSQDIEFKESYRDKVRDSEKRKLKEFRKKILKLRRANQKKENILKRGKMQDKVKMQTNTEKLASELRRKLVENEMQRRKENRMEIRRLALELEENNKRMKVTGDEIEELRSLPKSERKKKSNKLMAKNLRKTYNSLEEKNKKLKKTLKSWKTKSSDKYKAKRSLIVEDFAEEQQKINQASVKKWVRTSNGAINAIKEDAELEKKAAKRKVELTKKQNEKEASISVKRAMELEKDSDKRSRGQAKQERIFAKNKLKENVELDKTLEKLVEMTDASAKMEIAAIEQGNKMVVDAMPSKQAIVQTVVKALDNIEDAAERGAKRAREVIDFVLPYMDEDQVEEIIDEDGAEVILAFPAGGTKSSQKTKSVSRGYRPMAVERLPPAKISNGKYKAKTSSYNVAKRQIIAA
jgi:hypothetical protein